MLKNKKTLISLVIIAAIIIAGIVMMLTTGFKFSSELSEKQIDFSDIIYNYMSPVIIATVLILAYFAIKYRKQNWLKVIGIALGTIVVVIALALSVIVIAGIPLSLYTIPVLIGLYIITVMVLTCIFEKNK